MDHEGLDLDEFLEFKILKAKDSGRSVPKSSWSDVPGQEYPIVGEQVFLRSRVDYKEKNICFRLDPVRHAELETVLAYLDVSKQDLFIKLFDEMTVRFARIAREKIGVVSFEAELKRLGFSCFVEDTVGALYRLPEQSDAG